MKCITPAIRKILYFKHKLAVQTMAYLLIIIIIITMTMFMVLSS